MPSVGMPRSAFGEIQRSDASEHPSAARSVALLLGPPARCHPSVVREQPPFPARSPRPGFRVCSPAPAARGSSLPCRATEPELWERGRSWLLTLLAPSCLQPSQKNFFGNSRRNDRNPLSFTTSSAFDVNTEFVCWADTEKVTDQGNNKQIPKINK